MFVLGKLIYEAELGLHFPGTNSPVEHVPAVWSREKCQMQVDLVKSLQFLSVNINDGGLCFHYKSIQLLNYWKEMHLLSKDAWMSPVHL